ncbi:hypothetical protein BX600DRAFT_517719 [Xylariales sp. PMI_506]|nr:hypothetical protein BX600DRAFT_517719 [Xylariales sp. PMI_506]
MTRSRFPAPYATFQLAFRIISVLLCIATLCAASYASAKYGYGKGMVGCFIAALWTLTVDGPEITGLADSKRNVQRCTPGYLSFLELLTTAFCALLPIIAIVAFEGVYHECGGGRPTNICEEEERHRSEASSAVYAALLPTYILA